MTLYPALPFSDGSDWTADLATLAFNQVFDDQTQYLGHRPKISDASLSDASGALKQRYAVATSSFQVTGVAGLQVSYKGGYLRKLDGSTLTINDGLLTLPDNTAGFIYISNAGTVTSVATTGNVPAHRRLMAYFTTASGALTYLFDMRDVGTREIHPRMDAVRIVGGVNTTNKVCTNGEVLDDGLYSFQNFTVPSGVTVTVTGFAQIYASGNVNIAGTINVTPIVSGAAPFLVAVPFNGGVVGGLSGQGIGGGSGSSVGGKAYGFGVNNVGSGGGLGYAICTSGTSAGIAFGTGGLGGGGLKIEASGTVTITGSIIADGGVGGSGSILSGFGAVSGSGGGSGGLVFLSSLYEILATNTATIQARGGGGGNAVRVLASGDQGSQGGSGGGGGHIVFVAPNINTTGAVLQVNGGLQGSNLGAVPANLGGGGGGGYGGAGGNQFSGSVGKITYRNFIPF